MADSHKEFICSCCEKTFKDQASLKKHISNRSYRKMECPLCKKSICGHPSHLDLHMRTHTGERPYACPDSGSGSGCDSRFATTAAAELHRKRVHLRLKPHTCAVAGCGSAFVMPEDLVRHSRTHTGEKPYGCDTCEKRFPSSSNLKRHLQIHIGEKPFPCSHCGREFRTKAGLQSHVDTQHDSTAHDRTCEVCGKSTTATSFKRHLRTHDSARERRFTCQICAKSFYENADYKNHLSTHGPKEYMCGLCGKPFRQRGGLARHVRTHTKE